MADSNIKEALESVVGYIGEEVNTKLETKQDVFRVSEMDEATSSNVGSIVQYIGASIPGSYQHNYFYECKAQGTEPETYAWENVNVQDGSTGGHTIEDSTGVDMTARANLQFVGATVTDDSTNDRTVVAVDVSGKADKVASATNGNFAGLDSSGNLTDSGKKSSDFATASALAQKEDVFRYATMPTASSSNVGAIVQYIGTTGSGYTNGYFYICVEDSGSYSWEELSVGDAIDSRIDAEITGIRVELDTTTNPSHYIVAPYIEVTTEV